MSTEFAPAVKGVQNDRNPLRFIVLHCTATREGMPVQPAQVKQWHIQGNKWDRVGYNSLVLLDGRVHQFYQTDRDAFVDANEITWGAIGQGVVGPWRNAVNWCSIHFCYVGGLANTGNFAPKDTRTQAQKDALAALVKDVLTYAPNAQVCGHNQLDNKACPSFWVPNWAREIGLPEKNIYLADPFGYAKMKF